MRHHSVQIFRVSECHMTFVQVDVYTYNNCVYPPSNLVRRVSECDITVYRYRASECHMTLWTLKCIHTIIACTLQVIW